MRRRLCKSPANMLLAAKMAKRYVVKGETVKGETIPKLSMVRRPSSWEMLPVKTTLFTAMGVMFAKIDYTVFAITLNVHEKLSRRLYRGECRKYLRDHFRKTVQTVLADRDLYYFLVEEFKGPKRVHYHGVILIPNDDEPEVTAEKLQQALRKSRLCRKYKEIGKNKAVLITNKYGHMDAKQPIDFAWAWYLTKDLYPFTNIIMTNALRSASREFVEQIRATH